MNIQQSLQVVAKEIMKLREQIEKLLLIIEKLEKQKQKSTKKTIKGRARVKRKSAGQTDTGKVLSIINRYKNGVNIETLVIKTGFEKKKITGILYRLNKKGKIKRIGKGLYIRVK